ncbi:TetR/AcrR family transcriptional regulator [Actinoplanes sp. NPDC051861]|uniref:TetR/AcrR family transcriptional regulator n=1 Tax=Actinoplanes sp. NPDC051861 TaxID=3155170 RepID=UPI0034175A20
MTNQTRRSAADTREHILRTAADLFYWTGLHATGVDRIAAEAKVAPTTLYRSFPSKDELVAAYVRRVDEQTREWIEAAIQAAPDNPRSAALAVFEELPKRLAPESYRGCACQMTLAEYPDPTSAAHRDAVAAKVWLRDRFAELLRPAGVDADTLADRLLILYEGALAAAQSTASAEPAVHAVAMAETLLDAAGVWEPRAAS